MQRQLCCFFDGFVDPGETDVGGEAEFLQGQDVQVRDVDFVPGQTVRR